MLHTRESLVIKETTPGEITKIIQQLPNKTSSGHNGISNVLLKQLSEALSFPLSLIFNTSIYTGKFPELMKLAEIIPLYKGKDQDKRVNYRPVSLLLMMFKVLEKIIYKRMYGFITNITSLKTSMGSRIKGHVNM